MSGNQSDLPLLNAYLVDMIAAADLDENLSDVVMASYEMVDPSQVSALDAHWASVLTAMSNPDLVAEFLNLRSSIQVAGADTQQADNLVWLVSNPGHGGCDEDNGFGNGDDNAPGGSDPNNGAENDDDLGNDPSRCNAGQGGGGSKKCKDG